MVGYILRQHPSWIKFIEIARQLGTPLVFRMNLNQQSQGETWETHKRLLRSLTPIVDCGVHYVDVMCQMTRAEPVKVHAIGARLSGEVALDNYGQLQVVFADGSRPDERIDMSDEPDHDALCEREQRFLLDAIEKDFDLTAHMDDAVKSLRIVLAADRSIRSGEVVHL